MLSTGSARQAGRKQINFERKTEQKMKKKLVSSNNKTYTVYLKDIFFSNVEFFHETVLKKKILLVFLLFERSFDTVTSL